MNSQQSVFPGTVCAIALFALQPAFGQSNCGVESDKQLHQLIEEAFRPTPTIDETQRSQKLKELVRLVRSNPTAGIQQILLYEAKQREKSEPFGHGWSYSILREANIGPEQYPDAAASFLYCSDIPTRTEAWSFVRHALRCSDENGQPDLSHFRDHITGNFQKAAVAIPLKRALFEIMPAAAFFFFSGEHASAEIDRDEIIPYRRKFRVIDNALYEKRWLGGIPSGKIDDATTNVLRDLAASKYWWSRIFIAEVMAQNKEFRDADTIDKLRDDENELVRQSIASIDNPDPLRATPVDQ